MRAIYTQFSGLAGLLAFLNQLWSYAPIERSIIIGFGTALTVYLILLIADLAIKRILAHTPTEFAEETNTVSAQDTTSPSPGDEKKKEPEQVTAKAA